MELYFLGQKSWSARSVCSKILPDRVVRACQIFGPWIPAPGCSRNHFEFQVGNGALAGIAGVSMSFPLDLIKTKFQLNKAEYKGKFINAARGEMTLVLIT